MQKGNDTARNAHITLNAINVGLFLWQVPTGLDIVYKVCLGYCTPLLLVQRRVQIGHKQPFRPSSSARDTASLEGAHFRTLWEYLAAVYTVLDEGRCSVLEMIGS